MRVFWRRWKALLTGPEHEPLGDHSDAVRDTAMAAQ